MSDATSVSSARDRRWLILGVIGLAQLMVVLDLTVMNIALPSAQRALHFTTVDRQWVVTAYTLVFGGLLLPGGRLADLFGRKVTFLTGLAGFAGVSAIGGASVSFAMLVTARACQGAFAALLVPSALSLLITTFTEPKDRGKAFGVYGAIAAAGGAVGLLLGGALTEYLSWRWTLYVNLVFAAVAFTGGAVLLNTVFASAVTSYVTAHLAAARLIGRQALTGLALAHGYGTAFWWIAGIFAGGAVVAGALLRPGPLVPTGTPSRAQAEVTTAGAETGPALVTAPRAHRLIDLRGFLIHCLVLASARSWGNLRGGDHGRWMHRCPLGFDLEDSIAGASSLPLGRLYGR
jgi:MFS family permease